MTTVTARKRRMYATYILIYLFGGIEFAVVQPTLFLYLKNVYNAPNYVLGIVTSAYYVSALFSSPILGRVSDKWRCTKPILVICIMFQVVGSFLYLIDISAWLLVVSRFVSGFGAAKTTVIVAEIARYTPKEKRTRIISKLIALQPVAALLGPGLNYGLKQADFSIGSLRVNNYSAPGLFMVVMWLLLVVLIFVLYIEPDTIYRQEQKEIRDRTLQVSEDEKNIPNHISSSTHDAGEKTGLLGQNKRSNNGAMIDTKMQADDSNTQDDDTVLEDPVAKEGKLQFFYNEYIRGEIVALLCLFFCNAFIGQSIETMLLPLTDSYLDFGQFENSILYCFLGLETIVANLMLARISRWFADRFLIISGVLIFLLANILLLILLPRAPLHHRADNLPIFVVALFLIVASLPLVSVCTMSLFSKLTRRESQGLSQGLSHTVLGIGTILGPLWGASVSKQPNLLIGVLVGLHIIALVLLFDSFPHLRVERHDSKTAHLDNTREKRQLSDSP